MGGSGNPGPRKLDAGAKQQYKEIGSNQAAAFKDKIDAAAQKKESNGSKASSAAAPKAEEEVFGNWRMGNFGEAKKSTSNNTTTANGQPNGVGGGAKKRKNTQVDMGPLMEEAGMNQRPKTTCVNAHLLMTEDSKKMSKHAKRRANKKAKLAAAADEGNPTGQD